MFEASIFSQGCRSRVIGNIVFFLLVSLDNFLPLGSQIRQLLDSSFYRIVYLVLSAKGQYLSLIELDFVRRITHARFRLWLRIRHRSWLSDFINSEFIISVQVFIHDASHIAI